MPRPRKTKETKRQMSAVYLTPSELELVREAARQSRMAFSEFVRDAALAASRRRLSAKREV